MTLAPLYIASIAAAFTLIALGLRKDNTPPSDFINLDEQPLPPEPKSKPQIHCIYLTFNQSVLGSDLFQYFMSHQLIFNEQKIFHAIRDGETQFSIATLNAPGTFELETMNKLQFKGLSYFINDQHEQLERFDMMCEALLDAKERFGGTLCTKDKTNISIATLQDWREQIHEDH
ncbi:cell division protein ZipA C-terminal FtsZ-binding domain-containing protein [Gammaproteobacteria bacterium]|nr:cell division protein ZipA C-terminal FtsZ-binding domain-containing protein [Gammaproteobacteria bacterium]